jgi:hypothetical protein
MEGAMILTTFMAAVGVALAFQRQQKKHWLELGEGYRRAGLELPPPMPMIGKEEAWVSVAIGILLCLAGIGSGYVAVIVWQDTGISHGLVFPTLFFGSGGALIISARKALLLHKKWG